MFIISTLKYIGMNEIAGVITYVYFIESIDDFSGKREDLTE